MKIFTELSKFFFAYNCHYGIVSVYKSIRNCNESKINKVNFRTFMIITLLYVSIAISGYLTWPIDTPELIIFRDNPIFSDWIMIIGKLGIVLAITMTFGPNFSVLRISFFHLLRDEEEFTPKE